MLAEDVIIIGAGPAGLATALQLKRYGIESLLFEQDQIGGLLRNAHRVENYPGFPAGISGPALVQRFGKQAAQAQVPVTFEAVVELALESNRFRLKTSTRLYTPRIVVIASGTRPMTFPADCLPAGTLDRVCYEVYPLLRLADRRIAIVGAGDAAFDYALNLARRNDVTLLNRGERVKCLPLLWERARACPRIVYHARTRISGIERATGGGLWLDCASPAGNLHVCADYLIGALGREPRLDFLSAGLRGTLGRLEASGLLHLVGDVKNGAYRQTAIAVGDGILAAMKIYYHLTEAA